MGIQHITTRRKKQIYSALLPRGLHGTTFAFEKSHSFYLNCLAILRPRGPTFISFDAENETRSGIVIQPNRDTITG